MIRFPRSIPCIAAWAAASMLLLPAASAQLATGTTGIDASGNYQQEVQTCRGDAAHQDRATCLREARNAQAEKRRGRLDNAGGNFEANAVARCAAHQGEERSACENRVRGQGTVSGSVAGGGVLREIETRTVIQPSGSGQSQ